ncbi:MAG: glycosyltransferase family 2 protein [Chloroflexota bacterium]|nr:MAG: glycosyltransferase family 2 protein [Chloroflexota bacterium]
MLTCDRPALARRAVECLRGQTYPAKRLVIWDTGRTDVVRHHGHYQHCEIGSGSTATIGELRNKANERYTGEPSEIICHWDDDDWSHPNRIAEQVALMEATGAEVTGYNEMLFWRERRRVCSDPSHDIEGEAWIYTGTILGTSLCYRRSVWERFPFPATSYGEDTEFLKRIQHAGIKIACCSSVPLLTGEVRMIARIHATNTSKAYLPEAMRAAPHHWRRACEWDEHCRKVME